jgi:hypothetical protein
MGVRMIMQVIMGALQVKLMGPWIHSVGPFNTRHIRLNLLNIAADLSPMLYLIQTTIIFLSQLPFINAATIGPKSRLTIANAEIDPDGFSRS